MKFIHSIKYWNEKYDFWSFIADFLFVFGVIIFDWNPVLLILLLIIDTFVMFLFTTILFYLETKSVLQSIFFLLSAPFFLIPLIGLYASLEKFLKDIKMKDIIDIDPTQVINSYVLPIILVSSALNHYANFDKSLIKIKSGNYKGTFIKQFFLRIIFIMGAFILLAFGYYYFNTTIVLALIIIKATLRLLNKNYRNIII